MREELGELVGCDVLAGGGKVSVSSDSYRHCLVLSQRRDDLRADDLLEVCCEELIPIQKINK